MTTYTKKDYEDIAFAITDVKETLNAAFELYNTSPMITERLCEGYSHIEEIELTYMEEDDLHEVEMQLLGAFLMCTAELDRLFGIPAPRPVIEEGRSILDAIPPGPPVPDTTAEEPVAVEPRAVDISEISDVEPLNPTLSQAVHAAMTASTPVVPEVESPESGRKGARRRIK